MSIKMRIFGRVTNDLSGPLENAEVRLIRIYGAEESVIDQYRRTNAAGLFDFESDCDEGDHVVRCQAFGKSDQHRFTVEPGCQSIEVNLDLKLGLQLTLHNYASHEERLVPAGYGSAGQRLLVRADSLSTHRSKAITGENSATV
jgi:hypothetical protein